MLNQRFLPWVMWFLPLIFFGFQFILRLFPGLIVSEFLEKYKITATDFGLFASLYYIGYASMQLPMAFLLDKFGPRKVISLSAFLCAFATALFAFFDHWSLALVSRFLIGVGSVAGFLGVSKIISGWFLQKYYSRMVGLTFSFGLLGALYGGLPMSAFIEKLGWEKVNIALGGVAFFLAIFIFCFVRDKTAPSTENNLAIFSKIKMLFSYKPLLFLGLSNFLMVGALEGFADVWGIPYLIATYHISKPQAASVLSFIFMGMLIGGPLLAYFSEKYRSPYWVTSLCGISMSLLLLTILMCPLFISLTLLKGMMFLIGICCCYQVIVFTIGTQLVPASLTSLAVALLNCINMLGGSFFHTIIGRLMDFIEPPVLQTLVGPPTYLASTYTYTLLLIPLASLVGALLVGISKIKSARPISIEDVSFSQLSLK